MSSDHTAGARSQRAYTVTAHITVHADADLGDPFKRVAFFRALVDQLTSTPLQLDTPFGAGSAQVGLVIAVS